MQNQIDTVSNFITNLSEKSSALLVSYAVSVIGAVLIIIIGWIAARLLANWTRQALRRTKRVDATVGGFFANFVRYGVLVVVLVMVLGQFGVQTASIIAALGAAGLAIGLALQGTLQNVAAGIMLLVLRPFHVGDYIDTGSVAGVVEGMGLFTTEMKTLDGLYRTVPNSLLWNVPITNFNRNATRRFDLAIGIGYEDDINKAEALLLELAAKEERVLSEPAPATFVAELGDSAVTVTLRYWTASADFWNTSRDMTKRAKLAFDENGITIPYPQVTYSGSFVAGTPAST